MISEVGMDSRFLDISQLESLGMSNKIAYCLSITTEHRMNDKLPFLKFALMDVNGRLVTGYWWNAEQLMREKFQWAVGHLVEIECTPEFERSLQITALRGIDDSLDEMEILKEHFRRKLKNLDAQVGMLGKLMSQFMDVSDTHKAFMGALSRKEAMSIIKNSRHPDICDGMVGSRVLVLMGLTTTLVYTSALYGLTVAEARTALASAYLYQYLCAKYQPMTAKESAMWKLMAFGELSEVIGAVGPGADGDILDSIVNTVLELLGISECATMAGNMLGRTMKGMIELSKLGYYLSGMVGDVGAVVDGVTFIG